MRKLVWLAVIALSCLLDPLNSCGQSASVCVKKHVIVRLTQGQFDGLTDFVFNVGCGAFQRSTLLKDVNRNDMTAALHEFPKWTYVGKTKVPGLIRRRKDEMAMFIRK